MTCISSIVAQTSDKWSIHVVADCPPPEVQLKLAEIATFYEPLKDKIKFSILEKRYNDWGHTPRNYGLQMATEEWVVMTGEDNYYTPVFVSEMLKVATPSTHFVYCDMVHNWTAHQYIPIKCEIDYGKIDIGNFMTRTFNSKKLKLNNKVNQADYQFIVEYLERFNEGKVKKVEKILYVHN
jgi:glycosyltransferase involved in cell wall biosynthesis